MQEREEANAEKERPTPPSETPDVAPLSPGRPLTLEESIERMYERYARTFEILAQ